MERDIKQVIVFRKDLKMRAGKMAAQVAHGSMKVFFDMMQKNEDSDRATFTINLDKGFEVDRDIATWMKSGFKKVCLSCEDEGALLDIYQRAKSLKLPVAIIVDSGRTEFHGKPTRTVVAIGPADSEIIDRITGPDGAVKCKLA